jgi:hypothetical protein
MQYFEYMRKLLETEYAFFNVPLNIMPKQKASGDNECVFQSKLTFAKFV